MNSFELQYAINKQIPSIRYELRIQTNYGDIVLWDEDANYIAGHIETLLNYKLSTENYEEDP